MALANKNHMTANDSTCMAIIQASAAFYEHNFGAPEDNMYGIDHEPESREKTCGLGKNFMMSNSSSVSSPSSTSSNGLGYQEGHSVISFKPDYANFVHGNGTSLLSFEQNKKRVARNLFSKMMGDEDDDYPTWDENLPANNYPLDPSCTTTTTNHGPPETSSSYYAATGYGSPSSGVQFAWMDDQMANNIQELGKQETTNNKRPSTGESMQDIKKQCIVGRSSNPAANKKAKAKSVSPAAKDPQSLAAKNRRERISERLKILQDLVPNGSKVDLVTMLEKAISYVKFLQLQVKVLATDEFWPAQGGKAPDVSRVREVIDAILASRKDRNSSSK